jgi:hypothetical protein
MLSVISMVAFESSTRDETSSSGEAEAHAETADQVHAKDVIHNAPSASSACEVGG